MKHHVVYEIQFESNHYYRGVHSTNNIDDGYYGSGVLLNRYIDKGYKFKKDIVKVFSDRNSAEEFEKDFIGDLYDSDPLCLNLMEGGKCGPAMFSRESRKKMSDRQIGELNHFYGKKHKDSTKTLISQKQLGELNHNYGNKTPKEVKNKIAKTLKRSQAEAKCIHCGKVGGKSLIGRYHMDNCKNK